MKTCTKCKIEKPLTEFTKKSSSKDGLRQNCKSCVSEYRKENEGRIAKYMRDYYLSNFDRIKACQAQYNLNNSDRIAETKRQYNARNKSRISEHKRQYNAKNADKIYKRQKEKREENPEKIAKYLKQYNLANSERIAENRRRYQSENAERIAAQTKAYRENNPEKIAEHKRNRRAMKINAEGKHTCADISKIFDLQKGLCANCKTSLFKSGIRKMHIDHIMPLSLGGSNWPSNLQCLCPACNLRKRAKDPIAWAKDQGRLI